MARGSIKPRAGKHGKSYQVRVDYDPDPATGKRMQRSKTTHTRREAEQLLRDWLQAIDGGTAVLPSKLSVRDYLTTWLAGVKVRRRITTYTAYHSYVHRHMLPRFGSTPLQRLSAAQIETMETEMLTAGLSPTTVHFTHVVLRQALKDAVATRKVACNPTDGLKAPAAQRHRMTIWSLAQTRQFLLTTQQDSWPAYWMVAIYAGLRRGEIIGLRWSDLDAERGTLLVARALVRIKGQWYEQPPKSDAGVRTITLAEPVLTALTDQRRRQRKQQLQSKAWGENGFIFTDDQGQPLNPSTIALHFRTLLEKAEVPKITPHGLRHLSASIDLLSGTPMRAISERLGHSDPAMTARVYSHLDGSVQREAADRVAAALAPIREQLG